MDLFEAFAADNRNEQKTVAPPQAPEPARAAAVLTQGWQNEVPAPGLAPEALLEGLNDQQRAAVIYQGGPLLIIAGAGSGKTRVLTHRIAYLLATGVARSSEILAITFTNKAAAEMRERVGQLVGSAASRMWVSTFHSACVRILREQHEAAGLRSTFSIYDQQDSQRLLSMILKDQGVDSKQFSAKLIQSRISDQKNELVTAARYADIADTDPISEVTAVAYREYSKRLRQANAVDFDDIIMLTVQMLQKNPDIAEHYRRRFRHILVDEYQDTNHAQYVLVRTLVGTDGGAVPPAQLTVVGDSDQSIYAFRGASIRNIEEFEQDFPNANTILLEQNYRSTQNILSAANAVISKNVGRRKKKLWTAHGSGSKVTLDAFDNEHEEARFVVRQMDTLHDEGVSWAQIAVFYRTNAQSRALEETLLRSGIPYRLVGGTRFYERMEIKDALAYLQVISNPDDTVALRRIINTPRRGIGDKAQAMILAHADRYGISFGQALDQLDQIEGLSKRARTEAAQFWDLIVQMRQLDQAEQSAAHILDEVLSRSGYLEQLRSSEDPQDASRVENLAELLSVAKDFEQTKETVLEGGGTLEDLGITQNNGSLGPFLERIALVADADQVQSEEQSGEVTLMTVHTAKGLEFPYVFVTGLEDGTFPHRRSLDNATELAEERRLAYVAITRARKQLFLSRAATRAAWGRTEDFPQSRFLDDIPEEVLERRSEPTRETFAVSRSSASSRGDGGHIFGSGRPLGSGSMGFGQSSGYRAPSSSGENRKLGQGGTTKLGQSGQKPTLTLAQGDKVKHGTLGVGTVIGVEGTGASAVARIDFSGKTKRLLIRMAPIKKL